MLNSLVVSGSPSLGPVGSPANRIKMKMQDTSKDKFRNSRDDTNALDISRPSSTDEMAEVDKIGIQSGKKLSQSLVKASCRSLLGRSNTIFELDRVYK